jgi:hypothetical protein
MANIEASQPDVSLYDVAEHIVGYRSEDISEEEWNGPVFDKRTIEAWDRALKHLIAAVRDGRLKVRGRRLGSNHSEELQPDAFDDLKVCNPFADFYFGIEFSGKDVLKFDEDNRATIVKCASDFGGTSEVIWTHLFAVSGADVLKLWPAKKAPRLTDDQLRVVILNLVERLGYIPSQNKCAELVLKDTGRARSSARAVCRSVSKPKTRSRAQKEMCELVSARRTIALLDRPEFMRIMRRHLNRRWTREFNSGECYTKGHSD